MAEAVVGVVAPSQQSGVVAPLEVGDSPSGVGLVAPSQSAGLIGPSSDGAGVLPGSVAVLVTDADVAIVDELGRPLVVV